MFGEGGMQDLSAALLDDLMYSSLTWWHNEDTVPAANTTDTVRLFVPHQVSVSYQFHFPRTLRRVPAVTSRHGQVVRHVSLFEMGDGVHTQRIRVSFL